MTILLNPHLKQNLNTITLMKESNQQLSVSATKIWHDAHIQVFTIPVKLPSSQHTHTQTHTHTHTALPQSGSGRGWRVGITIFLLPQQKCLLEIQVGVGTYEIKITKYILNPFTMTQLKCLHGKCLEKRQAIVRFKMVIFSWKMLQLKGIPLMC